MTQKEIHEFGVIGADQAVNVMPAVYDNEALRHEGVVRKDGPDLSQCPMPERLQSFRHSLSKMLQGMKSGADASTIPKDKPKQISGRYSRLYKAHCQVHGSYDCNAIVAGYEVWLPPGCPHCRKELIQRRVARTLDIPRRYQDCTFDNYQIYDHAQVAPAKAIASYAQNFDQHFQQGEGMVFIGPKGTGKNHLAYAVAKAVMVKGYSVGYFTYSRFLTQSYSIPIEQRSAWVDAQTLEPDLLIFDELGRGGLTDASRRTFFDIVNARHVELKPIILISNHPVDELSSLNYFGPEVWSRILQSNPVYRFDWADKRSITLLDNDGLRT